MAVFKQGITGPHQKDEGEQMPFQLLGEDKTDLERIAHDDVDEYDHDDQCRRPGDKITHPGVQGVNPLANLFENSHQLAQS